MIASFLSQFGAALGKGYVLSGLFPAALYLLGWRWYRYGTSALAPDMRDLLESGAVTLSALALAALGLLFFAARGFFLYVLQTVPGPPLQGARDWLVGQEIRRCRRLRAEKERLLARLTAIDWARTGLDPDVEPLPGAQDGFAVYPALRSAKRARSLLRRRLQAEGPDAVLSYDEQVGEIADGLWDLRRLVTLAPDDTGSRTEIESWRSLLDDPDLPAKRLLGEVRRAAHGRWAELFAQCQSLPEEEWVRPTRLGNRLAALEAYAKRRYEIDTSTLWIRIWGILAPEERKQVTDAQLRVESLVNLCVAFLALALTVGVGWVVGERPRVTTVGARDLPGELWAAAFLAAALLLSLMSYRSAVFAFGTLAESIIRLVDLHRLKLLVALGYEPPGTAGEELKLWVELRGFFAQAKPRAPDRPLRDPTPAAKKE